LNLKGKVVQQLDLAFALRDITINHQGELIAIDDDNKRLISFGNAQQ